MQIQDYSTVVNANGAQEIFPAWSGSPDLVYMKITNISILASAVVWLSRTGNAAVAMPGSYALNPGDSELFQFPQRIPANSLTAIAQSGTASLTVEVAVDQPSI